MLSLLIWCFSVTAMEQPIKTGHAVFLFDNGETNFIASMLQYAQNNDSDTLKALDYRIIFMGASLDAMEKEPFKQFPDKIMSYKELGITQEVDRYWPREQMLSEENAARFAKKLHVAKKIWTGVSTSIFKQIINLYPKNCSVAVRDYPFAYDQTNEVNSSNYSVIQGVERVACMVAIPSEYVRREVEEVNKSVCVIGHPPCEEYSALACTIDKKAVMERMNLDPKKPLLVYTGSYGTDYEERFNQFLDYVCSCKDIFEKAQLLIVPHPRYKGVVEKRLSSRLDDRGIMYRIAAEFETDSYYYVKTIEAISSADLIITPEATGTLVPQANTIAKKIIHIALKPDAITSFLNKKNVITSVADSDAFRYEITREHDQNQSVADIFNILGIAKGAAARLWGMFKN